MKEREGVNHMKQHVDYNHIQGNFHEQRVVIPISIVHRATTGIVTLHTVEVAVAQPWYLAWFLGHTYKLRKSFECGGTPVHTTLCHDSMYSGLAQVLMHSFLYQLLPLSAKMCTRQTPP